MRALSTSAALRKLIPKRLRPRIRGLLPDEMNLRYVINSGVAVAMRRKPTAGPASRWGITIGILSNPDWGHVPLMDACGELGVPHVVVDLYSPYWLREVEKVDSRAFIGRPPGYHSPWKQLYDERTTVMAEELDCVVFPPRKSVWIYESKRRLAYWLQANRIPHPATWVFYDRAEALEFARRVPLPIVFKADLGSGGDGVRIVASRAELIRMVKACFGRGFRRRNGERRDRHRGSVELQEYIVNAREWRIIRMGTTYLGYEKGKSGGYHSGSKIRMWGVPPRALLEFVRKVTDRGGFLCTAVDVLENEAGEYLVSECHAYFGTRTDGIEMMVNGQPARMVYDEREDDWRVEMGYRAVNHCCNLRLEVFLELLGARRNPPIPVESAAEGEDRREWTRTCAS